jgi:hypothetical protein
MISFKQFLIEGGHATEKYGTTRAKQADVAEALKFVSSKLGIPEQDLKSSLLGSTELTLLGKRDSSGDVDIAIELDGDNYISINKKMLAAVDNKGYWNQGAKIGSYAVPVNDKKIQVDLMFVSSKEWAKFIYHSAEGRGSKYPGAVRNIILFTALTFVQELGKDFVERDKDGNIIARASRSIKLDTGMQRIFKRAKINSKTGKINKTLEKVSPEELAQHLKQLGKNIEFAKNADVINVPDKVASFIFGSSVKAKDIMTAEDVIKHIKLNMHKPEKVLVKVKSELERNNLPIPIELQQEIT